MRYVIIDAWNLREDLEALVCSGDATVFPGVAWFPSDGR